MKHKTQRVKSLAQSQCYQETEAVFYLSLSDSKSVLLTTTFNAKGSRERMTKKANCWRKTNRKTYILNNCG